MPHNLFLHSEIVKNKSWHKEDKEDFKKKLKYEKIDTIFSMTVGWFVNCAIIILAASTFFKNKVEVFELQQASQILKPILGSFSALIFAIALLFAGISSSVTSVMSGGGIFANFFKTDRFEDV